MLLARLENMLTNVCSAKIYDNISNANFSVDFC